MNPPSELKIPIIVYFPSKYVIKLSVLPSTRLSDLFRKIPPNDIFYVYNGTILSNNHTIISAGINPGDSLVLIFKNAKSQNLFFDSKENYSLNENPYKDLYNNFENDEVKKWMKLTQDSETFNQKMRMIVNQDNSEETARLKDILLSKIERKPRYFRKLCFAVQENSKNIFDNKILKNSSLVVNYTPTEEPCTEPLPVFFPQNDNDKLCTFEKNGEPIFSDDDSISPALKP